MPVKCVCGICGKDFNVKPHIVKLGKGKYCSKACDIEARRRGMVAPKGKNHSNYGKKFSTELRAKLSKAQLETPNHSNRGKHHTEETKQKISEANTGRFLGEKSPNWKGGTSKEYAQLRTTFAYRKWKRAVLGRDDYTCVKCGEREGVVPHHILEFAYYPDERFAVDNGVSVCFNCHMGLHDWTVSTLDGGTSQFLEDIG